VPDYRTPEEWQRHDERRARVQVVIDAFVQDAASLRVAMRLGEPAEVVEAWVDRVWDVLRDNLDGEQRLLAIVMLLEPVFEAECDSILRELREVTNHNRETT
jgi:hypothetical protein